MKVFLEPGGFKRKKGRGASGKTIVFGLLKQTAQHTRKQLATALEPSYKRWSGIR
jgi:hypothetical protein